MILLTLSTHRWTPSPVPPHGAIRPTSDSRSVPPGGHPLEVTISGVQSGGGYGNKTNDLPAPGLSDSYAGARVLHQTSASDDHTRNGATGALMGQGYTFAGVCNGLLSAKQ